MCGTASVCYLTGNTIQDAVGVGVGVGGGSHAFLESNVIQNNGAAVQSSSDGSQMFSSNDVFQGNAAQGVSCRRAYFVASNSSFLNNGVGILAGASTLLLLGGTISGSGADGMTILAGSTAVFQGADNNRQWRQRCPPGRRLFRGFPSGQRNGQLEWSGRRLRPAIPDHSFCRRTGGITNCVEPASSSKLKAVE